MYIQRGWEVGAPGRAVKRIHSREARIQRAVRRSLGQQDGQDGEERYGHHADSGLGGQGAEGGLQGESHGGICRRPSTILR